MKTSYKTISNILQENGIFLESHNYLLGSVKLGYARNSAMNLICPLMQYRIRNFVLFGGPLEKVYSLGKAIITDEKINERQESRIISGFVSRFDAIYDYLEMNKRVEEEIKKDKFNREYEAIFNNVLIESLNSRENPFIITSQFPYEDTDCARLVSYFVEQE